MFTIKCFSSTDTRNAVQNSNDVWNRNDTAITYEKYFISSTMISLHIAYNINIKSAQ